ncbi:hypothetical protein DSO57_1031731 [Entomophthora muscae]|uniref:Uncharacterized protein n=1 Tax=Entomophthora muscae TaxID=34485 RepID=A0ACC2T119_9FUNG|nr:hypothetical protein DSO57_1031731 [Entomophthora muscae]
MMTPSSRLSKKQTRFPTFIIMIAYVCSQAQHFPTKHQIECSDDSSDDGASLSTCTVKAYNSSGTLTNRSSHHNLSPDAERALESLQTQVAALNERLEVMRYQLERRDLTQVKKPSSGWKSVAMGFLRNALINLMVVGFITMRGSQGQSPSKRMLFFQLIFPFSSFLKLILKTMQKLIR